MVRGGRYRGSIDGREGVGATAIAGHQTVESDETRSAPEDGRSPQRRCIVTGETRDRGVLLRFVVGPDGTIVPDIDARLPGRGLWLTPRRDIVERAVAKRVFARAARRQVLVAPELVDRIEALLVRRCSDSLGLARRAGSAVSGFDRVGEALRHGRAALLLCALDGAESGRQKLAALGRELQSASVMSATELGAAFGRERVVHAAVAGGALCERLWLDLVRLAGLRPGAAVDAAAVAHEIGLVPARPAVADGGTEAHD